jgi:hypothetical protein
MPFLYPESRPVEQMVSQGLFPFDAYGIDRVLPLELHIHERVMREYCLSLASSFSKEKSDGHDCLIGPHHGRRQESRRASRFRYSSVQSYFRHVDQMKELSLSPQTSIRALDSLEAFGVAGMT